MRRTFIKRGNRLLPLCHHLAGVLGATLSDTADSVTDVHVELSSGVSLPLEWAPNTVEYSLAVPNDAPMVAIRVSALEHSMSTGEEGLPASGNAQRPGDFFLALPWLQVALPLLANTPSQPFGVGTEEATVVKLIIATSEFTLSMIRARLASNGQGPHPDIGRHYPARGTLTGLVVTDSMGRPAHMSWFLPRHSLYRASIEADAHEVRVLATPNDPNAELAFRHNGLKWDVLVPGLASAPVPVRPHGWTLLEVRVSHYDGTASAMVGSAPQQPLTYQLVVTKDAAVCHPNCRQCSGPGVNECLSCSPPLVWFAAGTFGGRCLFHPTCELAAPQGTSAASSSARLSASSVARYFDPDGERCLQCHPSCAACRDGSEYSCTLCDAASWSARFLQVSSDVDVTGRCVTVCPLGYWVQPSSQQCRRGPRSEASSSAQPFYLQLALLITPEDFLGNPEHLRSTLLMVSRALAISPRDVHFHKWEPAATTGGVLGVAYFVEVRNPFVHGHRVERDLDLGHWSSVLPVPVGDVRVLPLEALSPSPRPLDPNPLLEPWMWAVICAGLVTILMLYPLYRFYFIRKHYERTPYRPNTKKEEQFIQTVLDAAPEGAMSALVKHSAQK